MTGLLLQEVHEGLLEGFIVVLGGLEQGLPGEDPGFQDPPVSFPGYHPLTPLVIQAVVQGEGVAPLVRPRVGVESSRRRWHSRVSFRSTSLKVFRSFIAWLL